MIEEQTTRPGRTTGPCVVCDRPLGPDEVWTTTRHGQPVCSKTCFNTASQKTWPGFPSGSMETSTQPEVPSSLVPTSSLRLKSGKLQQLHADSRGGNRRYWIDVPHVEEDAPDVI